MDITSHESRPKCTWSNPLAPLQASTKYPVMLAPTSRTFVPEPLWADILRNTYTATRAAGFRTGERGGGLNSGSDAYDCVSVPNGSNPSIARDASSGVTGGDPYRRRPLERRAVRVERRPVHHSIAFAAMPRGVATAAVTEARDMADEGLIRAEWVAVRAPGRPAGHPPAVRGLHQLAQHSPEHRLRRRMRSATYPAGDPAAGAVLTACD
jgi:hypothetical protein